MTFVGMSFLDSYGGGDYATEDLVAELLDQIRERLETKNIDNDHRQEILNLVPGWQELI